MKTRIMSLGGSIICPDEVDVSFLKRFKAFVEKRVSNRERIVVVCGGGNINRKYLRAASKIRKPSDYDADMIGVYATRLNAMLVKSMFGGKAHKDIVENPSLEIRTTKKIIVASGWKPGFSSDYDAVMLASRLGSDTVINLSNIPYVYNKDPSKSRDAKPFKSLGWDEYLSFIKLMWSPRLSTPFDPVASRLAKKRGIKVVVLDGKNLKNLENMLDGKPFRGTVIGG